MILIVSKNNESTTTEVIKWLIKNDKKYIRVNEDDVFEIKIENCKIILQSNNTKFALEEITSVWYRRAGLKFKRNQYDNEIINIHMQEAQYWLEEYVLFILESKNHINKQTQL